jgi:phosphoesterase RecJ-like protein
VRAHGGRPSLVCSDRIPPLYAFLPGVELFGTDPPPGEAHDVLVICDAGGPDRIGPLRDRHRALLDGLPRLILDHHVSSEASGPLDWVDPTAAATCEMTTLLARRLGVPLETGEGSLATALWAARFRPNDFRPSTL